MSVILAIFFGDGMWLVRYGMYCLLIGFGVLLAYEAVVATQLNQELDAHGLITQATITQKWHERDRYEHYYVRYTYGASGDTNQFTAIQQIPKTHYDILTPGSVVTIRYLRDHPDRTKIEPSTPNALPGLFLASVFILFGTSNLRKAVRESQQYRYRSGRPIVSQTSIDYFSRSTRERRR